MPVFWLLAAYAAGSTVAVICPLTTDGPVIAMIITLLGVSWLSLSELHLGLERLCRRLLFGLLAANKAQTPPDTPWHVSHYTDLGILSLEVRLVTAESTADGGQRLSVAPLGVVIDGTYRPVQGRLRVKIREGTVSAIPGQVIRLRSRLWRPMRFGTPGEFDYPLYLASQEIYTTAYVEKGDDVVLLADHPATRHPFWERTRFDVARGIEAAVPGEEAGLVKALTVGMRGETSLRQRRLLSEGGVALLFAISGLHFGLLALLLYTLMSWLYRRSELLTLRYPPRRVLPVTLLVRWEDTCCSPVAPGRRYGPWSWQPSLRCCS